MHCEYFTAASRIAAWDVVELFDPPPPPQPATTRPAAASTAANHPNFI
jgi:hypothetical protein